MYTQSALRSLPLELQGYGGVTSRARLRELGFTTRAVSAQVAARRWRAYGRAVLLSNTTPTRWQQRRICLANCDQRALLTSFTVAEESGLVGWERKEVHVLAPAGTRRPDIGNLVLHRTADWSVVEGNAARRFHGLAQALVLAASSFRHARPACAILAAGVQQRLVTATDLRAVVDHARRVRHRRALLLALDDIAQGAHALSEIDFGRLCRRYGLPTPRRQSVRNEPNGRRRYLDVEWELPDGSVLAAEVDGAQHLEVRTWDADQLRQNEVVIGGTTVLRFPVSVVRHQPDLVADQLRRALHRS